MEFNHINSAEDLMFAEAYRLYEASFPKYERRLPEKQKSLMANPLYHFEVITHDGAFIGIILYWDLTGYVYIEHFAIQPLIRGKSMGSRVLERFCDEHSSIILEIDPPVIDISLRRERFYQRIGFKSNGYAHAHPAYHKQFPPHKLVVMSFPQSLSFNEYKLFQSELAETVMRDAENLPG